MPDFSTFKWLDFSGQGHSVIAFELIMATNRTLQILMLNGGEEYLDLFNVTETRSKNTYPIGGFAQQVCHKHTKDPRTKDLLCSLP